MDSYLTSTPVKLHSVYEMAELRAWHSDLKHVSLSFYRQKIGLDDYVKAICDAFTLESLEIICGSASITQLPASLWTPQLKELRIVHNTLLTRITRIFTKQFVKIRENSCHSCQKSIACSTKKIVSHFRHLIDDNFTKYSLLEPS